MNERIKQIRKAAGLTQPEFAESLGLSRSMIAQVETNAQSLSSRAIREICRLYNVNEEWLRFGTGEMYKPLSRQEQILKFVNDCMESESDDARSLFLEILTNLSEDDWAAITRVIQNLKNKKEDV